MSILHYKAIEILFRVYSGYCQILAWRCLDTLEHLMPVEVMRRHNR